MAGYFIGHGLAAVGAPGDVDTVQRNLLGLQLKYKDDTNGLQTYVYLAGVASCANRDAVSFNASTFVAVRLIPDAVGRVAIASGAILAANWGWFLVEGFGSVNSDTVAAAGGLFIDATAGRVDDASVAGDMIYGMVSTAADTANVLPVQLSHPYVTNTVPA